MRKGSLKNENTVYLVDNRVFLCVAFGLRSFNLFHSV